MHKPDLVIEKTKNWLIKVVLGLNFCPFAYKPFKDDSIRYTVVDDCGERDILQQLIMECELLDKQQDIATTLLILSTGFDDFYQYLNLLEMAEKLLAKSGYEGVYQLASFHPDYCFADVEADDVSNFTNRSPWPMLHILREQVLSDALDSGYDTQQIPNNNIAQCHELGVGFFQNFLNNK